MHKNSDNFSIQDAMKLAQSEAGQQLIAMLQSQNSQTIDQAMAQAAAGDLDHAKQSVSSLLASPEIRALLEKLGGSHNG